MTPAVTPQGGQQPPNPQSQTGDPQQQQAQAMLQEFRPLADAVQQLGKKYPEGQEEAATILKSVEKWMGKVAGNPQRVPEAKAPPV